MHVGLVALCFLTNRVVHALSNDMLYCKPTATRQKLCLGGPDGCGACHFWRRRCVMPGTSPTTTRTTASAICIDVDLQHNGVKSILMLLASAYL